MKTKNLVIYIAIGFLAISLVVFVNKILAQEANEEIDIQYPVEELGNCESEADCRLYCDKPENLRACLDFARENNLMSDEELAQAEKFLEAGGEGPGGCTGEDECEEYCNDISHIDECISFAEENNLIPPEELEEAKRVQAAIKRGVNPPPCGNKRQCDVYCEEPEHMEECITFGLEAGFIQGKEAEDAQKMLAAVRRGIKPPPCRGKEACDEYCSEPENMEVCMNFALEAGFMSEEEKEGAQKMLQAIKKGIKPPPCKGREECDIYCSEEEHFEECMNFAVAAGFMSEQEAQMARKTGGKGPGDCKGKEECEAFCNNPDNQEICLNFAIEHGLIPEEDLKKMEEGKQQMMQSLEQAPREVLECLEGKIGIDMVEKIKSGVMPPRDIGDKMRECFEKMGPPQGPGGPEGGIMPPGQTGPGGCQTPEECQSFCQNNPEQCQGFGPSGSQEGQRPSEGQSCEGENCQYGPGPGYQEGGEFSPPQGMDCSSPAECEAKIREQIEQQIESGIRQEFEGQIPSGEQQPVPSESSPPPPSESTPLPEPVFINLDSLIASVVSVFINFLFGR